MSVTEMKRHPIEIWPLSSSKIDCLSIFFILKQEMWIYRLFNRPSPVEDHPGLFAGKAGKGLCPLHVHDQQVLGHAVGALFVDDQPLGEAHIDPVPVVDLS